MTGADGDAAVQQMHMARSVAAACIAWFASNLDELVLNAVLFAKAQADADAQVLSEATALAHPAISAGPSGATAKRPRNPLTAWHIAAGEYLGLAVILGVSCIGAASGLLLSEAYIGFVGFLPIALGVWQMLKRCYRMCQPKPPGGTGAGHIDTTDSDSDLSSLDGADSDTTDDDDDGDTAAAAAGAGVVVISTSPVRGTKPGTARSGELRAKLKRTPGVLQRAAAYCFDAHTLRVLALTVANGTDSIAVFVPLLARADVQLIAITSASCVVLQTLWLVVSWTLVRCACACVPRRGLSSGSGGGRRNVCKTAAAWVVPVLLVAVGVYVLIDAGTAQLIADAVRRHL